MEDSIGIFWFRRDLRLEDNCALYHALQSGKKILPIFIFDTNILDSLSKEDARVNFIHLTLKKINQFLITSYNSSITIFHDKPINVFQELIKKYPIECVYTNHDYEPYAIQRDNKIRSYLKSQNIKFKSYKDHVIFETDEVVKDDGLPYKVFTPYSKKWIQTLSERPIEIFKSEEHLFNLFKTLDNSLLSLEDIGFKSSKQQVSTFNLSSNIIENYEATRNFPALFGTSRLGPHLRFGTISIRQVVLNALKPTNITFLKELIWREFFIQILWHYPHTVTKSFKPQYEGIKWRNNMKEFDAWKNGNTGYPLVDAGMRELNATGFMHNRVRMLVGSFLCKHLLIDWRLGEAYFAERLHDYEMASNIGNWQWVAGCGVDASPYFRIFNPTTQIKKFDKDFDYIKKWVPEFQEFTYIQPIVEHNFARLRCLKVYKQALSTA